MLTVLALAGMLDLQQLIFDSQSRRCVGKPAIIHSWAITQDIVIRRVETWIGTNGGDPFPAVDVYTTVDTLHPTAGRFILSFFGLDHYVPFTGAHEKDKLFPLDQSPVVRAGSQLRIEHMCAEVANLPSNSHVSVIVTYTVR